MQTGQTLWPTNRPKDSPTWVHHAIHSEDTSTHGIGTLDSEKCDHGKLRNFGCVRLISLHIRSKARLMDEKALNAGCTGWSLHIKPTFWINLANNFTSIHRKVSKMDEASPRQNSPSLLPEDHKSSTQSRADLPSSRAEMNNPTPSSRDKARSSGELNKTNGSKQNDLRNKKVRKNLATKLPGVFIFLVKKWATWRNIYLGASESLKAFIFSHYYVGQLVIIVLSNCRKFRRMNGKQNWIGKKKLKQNLQARRTQVSCCTKTYHSHNMDRSKERIRLYRIHIYANGFFSWNFWESNVGSRWTLAWCTLATIIHLLCLKKPAICLLAHNTHTYTHTRTHTHTHAHTHARTHARARAHTHTHTITYKYKFEAGCTCGQEGRCRLFHVFRIRPAT